MSLAEPVWEVTDPEAFRQAVRASEGRVRAVRYWVRLYDDEKGHEALRLRCYYAVRAESPEGFGTFRFTEHLPLRQGSGRIVADEGSMWRWLLENAEKRVWIDTTTSGSL